MPNETLALSPEFVSPFGDPFFENDMRDISEIARNDARAYRTLAAALRLTGAGLFISTLKNKNAVELCAGASICAACQVAAVYESHNAHMLKNLALLPDEHKKFDPIVIETLINLCEDIARPEANNLRMRFNNKIKADWKVYTLSSLLLGNPIMKRLQRWPEVFPSITVSLTEVIDIPEDLRFLSTLFLNVRSQDDRNAVFYQYAESQRHSLMAAQAAHSTHFHVDEINNLLLIPDKRMSLFELRHKVNALRNNILRG
jgi:hypothetical protein